MSKKLERVFMKHYAPNHMLAPKDITGIIKISQNVNQVIYTLGTICEPNIMILAQAFLEIICSQGA